MKCTIAIALAAFSTFASYAHAQKTADTMIEHYKSTYGSNVLYLSYSLLSALPRAMDQSFFKTSIVGRYQLNDSDMRAFFRSERFADPTTSLAILRLDLDSLELCTKRANDLGLRVDCRRWTKSSVATLLMLMDTMQKLTDQAEKEFNSAIRADQKLQKIREYSGLGLVVPGVITNAQSRLAAELLQPGKLAELKSVAPLSAYREVESWLTEASKLASQTQIASHKGGPAVLSLEGSVFVMPESSQWAAALRRDNSTDRLRAMLGASSDVDEKGNPTPEVFRLKEKLFSEALRRSGKP